MNGEFTAQSLLKASMGDPLEAVLDDGSVRYFPKAQYALGWRARIKQWKQQQQPRKSFLDQSKRDADEA